MYVYKMLGLGAKQKKTVAADTPYIVFIIYHDFVETILHQRFMISRRRLIAGKLISIETVQSVPCGNPQHTVPVLDERGYTSLRKPVMLGIYRQTALIRRLCRHPKNRKQYNKKSENIFHHGIKYIQIQRIIQQQMTTISKKHKKDTYLTENYPQTAFFPNSAHFNQK